MCCSSSSLFFSSQAAGMFELVMVTVLLFCPLVQMKHVEERFGPETNKEVLLLCIGITSCIGRFIFGRVADYIPGVKKVYLQVRALTGG